MTQESLNICQAFCSTDMAITDKVILKLQKKLRYVKET